MNTLYVEGTSFSACERSWRWPNGRLEVKTLKRCHVHGRDVLNFTLLQSQNGYWNAQNWCQCFRHDLLSAFTILFFFVLSVELQTFKTFLNCLQNFKKKFWTERKIIRVMFLPGAQQFRDSRQTLSPKIRCWKITEILLFLTMPLSYFMQQSIFVLFPLRWRFPPPLKALPLWKKILISVRTWPT